MNLQVRLGASKSQAKASFFHVFQDGLPPEGVAQIQAGSSVLWWSNQETSSQIYSAIRSLVNPKHNQVDKQD